MMALFSPCVWDAAETGNLHKLVAALALNPKLVDAPCPSGRRGTPMRIAAAKGHVEIMTKLVELGSTVIDAPNTIGWTSMYAAACYGRVSVIETLVRLGSTAIDTPDSHGETPMHAAARNGHVSVIETLVRLGSTAIDTPDDYGRTPLYMAALCDHTDSVKILKMLGADCSNVSNSGISDDMPTLLNAQVDEDETAELRSRVYFSRSLIERLLFELEARRNRKTTPHAQTMFN